MSGNLIAALEIGGTKLQAALGTADGAVLYTMRKTVDLQRGVSGILDWCRGAILELEWEAEQRSGAVKSIGIGFGGPIESATGKVFTSHQVSGWNGVNLLETFSDSGRRRVVVANDSNAAGWAEYRLGSGQGTRQFVYMNIGSGIGGAFVLDGALYDGQGFGAGEIGHTWVSDWSTAAPGSSEKLENLCSGWAIERRIRSWPSLEPGSPLHALAGGDCARLTCAMLGEAAALGDPRAGDELDRVAGSVAHALANVLALVQPERIALGGGVSLIGEPLIGRIRERLDSLAFGPCRDRYDLVPCVLGESVVLHGALLLAGS